MHYTPHHTAPHSPFLHIQCATQSTRRQRYAYSVVLYSVDSWLHSLGPALPGLARDGRRWLHVAVAQPSPWPPRSVGQLSGRVGCGCDVTVTVIGSLNSARSTGTEYGVPAHNLLWELRNLYSVPNLLYQRCPRLSEAVIPCYSLPPPGCSPTTNGRALSAHCDPARRCGTQRRAKGVCMYAHSAAAMQAGCGCGWPQTNGQTIIS